MPDFITGWRKIDNYLFQQNELAKVRWKLKRKIVTVIGLVIIFPIPIIPILWHRLVFHPTVLRSKRYFHGGEIRVK